MKAPKIAGLSELHRAGEHLVAVTLEVDIVDFPRLVGGLESLPGVERQILSLLDVSAALGKIRDVEAAAEAAKEAASAPAPSEAVPEPVTATQ